MLRGLLWGQYLRLPDGIRRAVLARRRAPLWRQAGIVFVHIPKAAGTSFSRALYGDFLGHIRASDIKAWAPADISSLPSFAITRNPWDRVVSAYRYSRRLHERDWKRNRDVPDNLRRQVPHLDSFAAFVTQWLQHRDVTKLNPIYQPQSLFVCDSNNEILVSHVGRLENMDPTRDFLRRHTGADPAIERSNPSGRSVDFREYYTPELIELIGRIYADDVRNFGYDFHG